MSRFPHNRSLVVLVLGLLACTTVLADASRPVSITQVSPVYPEGAGEVREDVEVLVAVKVLANGSVGDAQVARSELPGVGFEQSALDAVRQWRFRPAESNGFAVDSIMYIKLNYRTPDPSYFSGKRGTSSLVPTLDQKAFNALVRERNATRSLDPLRRPTLSSASTQYRNARIPGTRMFDRRKIRSANQKLRDVDNTNPKRRR